MREGLSPCANPGGTLRKAGQASQVEPVVVARTQILRIITALSNSKNGRIADLGGGRLPLLRNMDETFAPTANFTATGLADERVVFSAAGGLQR